ncbi:hypothetical protein [Mesorhizobium wenxiniae]|uniref:Uncharacterized protein n=1 Tax=Mesorhizobium wenxiniae TaxID=2014805 RepID=A0A271KEY1_9HYPH|nr:hypothetical protein [Mesorhizobium wenxiniae]PAP94024.1 hypothetical protein CIT31_16795 [Mesorhizobium wenxiniae]
MTSHDAKLIREHITSLQGWISHWQDDAFCRLIPTESSLIIAKAHAESALTLLDRMETEQKETA